MLAIPWLVLVTTGSATKMGLVAGAEMLPYVLSGVLAAPLADRLGVRRATIVVDAGSALAMAGIAAAPRLGFGWLLVLVAVAGATRGLGDRVKHVMLRPLAEEAGIKVIRVTSAYEGFSRTAMLVGSAAGGLLIAWVGPLGALWAARPWGGCRRARCLPRSRSGTSSRCVAGSASCGGTTCCPA